MRKTAIAAFAWFAFGAQAQTTQAIVPFPPGGALDALTRIMAQTVAEQAVHERIRVLGIEPAPTMSSEEGIRWIAAQHDKWSKLIREKGIRAE